MKKSAVVVFPGRGTYGKDELGYLSRHHADKDGFLSVIDDHRRAAGRAPVRELDGAKGYAAARHASSVNASALIYACALCDFQDIDGDRFDIVAVCGNSLGWYLTLAAGGALAPSAAINLIDAMGALMEERGAGGQMIYPLVDEDWRASAAREKAVAEALHAGRTEGEAFLSIRLGGMAALAGDEAGLAAMERSLPPAEGRYPFRLARHAAFHTPLLAHVAEAARETLPRADFHAPRIPVIDGGGQIWSPWSTDTGALYDYTLGTQIIEPYDFSKSIEVAVKEFAPAALILAGPGASLGAPIAQELIRMRWNNLDGKAAFAAAQKENPFLIAMGRADQRPLAVRSHG